MDGTGDQGPDGVEVEARKLAPYPVGPCLAVVVMADPDLATLRGLDDLDRRLA